MKKIVVTLFLLGIQNLFGQYLVGSRTLTFVDSSRSNRNVPIEIYYPAEQAGPNTFPALGIYPLITLGHGFVMSIDAYYNFRDTLVPKGYVIALVNTESSFSPSHLDFALDLLFINNKIKYLATTDPTFFLHPFLNGKSCIMGHSMGGGSSLLTGSIAQPNEVDCIAGFAPAETTPSAISAVSQFDLPLIIFSGGADGVTPPPQNHLPMYDSSASSCKYFVDIIGGGHCYFANPNVACDFGESISSTGITITRAEQQAITFQLLQPWLAYYLKNDANGLVDLNSKLQNSTTSNYLSSCNSISGIHDQGNWSSYIQWEINQHVLEIRYLKSIKGAPLNFNIQNITGQWMLRKNNSLKQGESAQEILDTLSPGIYILQLSIGKKSKSIKFSLH